MPLLRGFGRRRGSMRRLLPVKARGESIGRVGLVPEGAIYWAEVTHTRAGKVRHRFRHSVFYLYLDLDRLDDFAGRSWLFSRNRFNLLSFFDRDHGCRDGRPCAAWVKGQLKGAGLYDPQGRVFLLTLPRLLGYVFNPLRVS